MSASWLRVLITLTMIGKVKGAYGMDFGSDRMLGHNAGFQLTVSKSGIFKL